MDDLFEQLRDAMSESIEITFDRDRPSGELIEQAIASMKPLFCRQHPDEILAVDIEAMKSHALRNNKVKFTAIYDFCPACPRNDRLCDDVVEDCAMGHRSSTRDRPMKVDGADIEVEQSPQEQLARWLQTVGDVACPRHNEPLRRIMAGVTLKSDPWNIAPRYIPCARCGLERAGVTPDEARASFDNFVTDSDVLRQHLETCRKFASNPSGVLVMMGGCGTGKTHLAISILREAIRRRSSNIQFAK